MRAVVQAGYGPLDVLHLEEVPRPTPADDEVLIRVRAAAVTLAETITRKGRPLVARFFTGLLRPRQPIPGSEFSGDVEAVGRHVTRFEAGDEVFGVTGSAGGCFSEYMCMPEDGLVAIKPANATFEEAASVCGALAAWNFLRDKADVQPGQKVLVNGASGAIGTAAVQVARRFGAHVTAVCSTGEVELVESLGADKVVDDTSADFTKSPELYDVIFDAESTSSYRRCRASLAEGGVYLRTFPGPAILLEMLATSRFGHTKAVVSATGLMPISRRRTFLDEVTKLVEAGEMRSVIDRSFPLEDVADAYHHAERGTQRGTVMVTMEPATGRRATDEFSEEVPTMSAIRVAELTRYGKGIDDLPKRVMAKQAGVLFSELRRRYGLRGLAGMAVSIARERRKIQQSHPETVGALRRDWGSGAVSEALAMTALFNVLAPIEGREGAYDVARGIFEKVAPLSMTWLYQSDDLARCEGDRFENFKQFHFAMFENSQRLFPNVQSDEGDLFTTTVTRCANVEVFGALGCPELGRLGCDHDLAGYPAIADEHGFEFRRPTTIAKGGDSCRFRFYRKGTAPATEEIGGVPVTWTDALNR